MCSAEWNESHLNYQEYSKLVHLKRHACVETYFIRRMKRPDGNEYLQQDCRYTHPNDLNERSKVMLDEFKKEGVRAYFISKLNDTRLNQY